MSVAVPHETIVVRSVHAVIAGRKRIHSPSVRRAPRVAAALEALLLDHASIHAASANVLTGNVLIYYSPDLTREASVDGVCPVRESD